MKSIPLPDLKNVMTFQSGFIAVALALFGLSGWNYYATSGSAAVMATDGTLDITALITAKIMSYGPALLGMLAAWIAKLMGVSPEYVKAAQDFAKNPDVEDIERRFLQAVVGKLTPILSKYPEVLISILKAIAPSFVGNSEILSAINALGAALINHMFVIPVTDPIITPVVALGVKPNVK